MSNRFCKIIIKAGIPCILATTLAANAEEITNQVVTGAQIIGLQAEFDHQISYIPEEGEDPENAAVEDTLKAPGSQLLLLAHTTNSATLTGLSAFNEHIGPDVILNAGSVSAVYAYPCDLVLENSAHALVSWKTPHAGIEPGCTPPGLEVAMGGRDGGHAGQLDTDESGYAFNHKSQLQTQIFPSELGETIGFEYCSVVASTGDHWFVQPSPIVKLPLGITSSSDPCQQAKEQCEEDASGNCFVANWEEWSLDETELTVSLDCVDDWNWRDSSIEAALVLGLIPQVQDIAKAAGATGCVFNIYTPGEIVVEPNTDDVVLAQVRNFENRVLAVDALAGDILVKSSLEPDGVLVEEGNTYALVDSTLINQEEGTNQGYISIPPAPIQREVFNAPLLQELVEEQLPNNQDTEQLAEIASQEFQNTINELLQVQEQQEDPF